MFGGSQKFKGIKNGTLYNSSCPVGSLSSCLSVSLTIELFYFTVARVLIETLCKLPRALHVGQTFTDMQARLNILRRFFDSFLRSLYLFSILSSYFVLDTRCIRDSRNGSNTKIAEEERGYTHNIFHKIFTFNLNLIILKIYLFNCVKIFSFSTHRFFSNLYI